MRKKIQLAAQIIFLAILIVPSLTWGVLGLVAPSAMEALDYDLGENREKNPFPEKFDAGSYTEELEAYYADRIPFRSVMITANKRLSGSLERVYLKQLQPALAGWLYRNNSPTDPGQDGEQGGEYLFADGELSGDEDGMPADGEQPGDEGGMPADGMTPGDEEPEKADPGDPADEEPEEDDPGEGGSEEYIIEDESGHRYKRTELVEPTCVKDGQAVYVCVDCEETYTEELPAKGHTVEKVKTVEATFEEYGYTEYHCSACGLTYKGDIVVKQVEDTYLPANVVGEGVLLGRCDWLFYTADNSVGYYKGTNLLSNEKMAEYLSLLVRLQEICDRRGIRLVIMIMPNKDQVYPEYMPSYKVEQIEKRVDRLADYVRKNSTVNFIYPIKALKKAKAEWQTYYKYDTHWNNAGAFIGTQELYGALGLPVTDLHDVSISTQDKIGGDLLAMGGLDETLYDSDTEYLVNYKPEVHATGSGNVHTIYYADSDSPNQCNFVMLADSYRVMMVPYLEKDFSHVTIAHRDYTESVKSSVKEADILVVASVERYENRIYKTIQELIDILGEEPEGSGE